MRVLNPPEQTVTKESEGLDGLQVLIEEARQHQHRRWMLTAAVIILAVLGVVAGLVFSHGPGTARPRVTSARHVSATSPSEARVRSTCESSQLSLASDRSGWNATYGAMGQFGEPFTFRNVSRTTCRLTGWPEVQPVVHGVVQAAPTTRVLQNASPSSPVARVTLKPGGTASFEVYGEDWNSSNGTNCPDTTTGFAVTPPNDDASILVSAVEPDCGFLWIAPMIAGSVDLQPWNTSPAG
jgi:Domain of unknown function (DUF4232)